MKLWRITFRLRTLLLAMLVACVALGWAVENTKHTRKQLQMAGRLGEHGWHISYYPGSIALVRNQNPPGPAWARVVLGDGFFATSTEVWVEQYNGFPLEVSETVLADLRQIDDLSAIEVRAPISQADVEKLRQICTVRVRDGAFEITYY